MKKTLAILTIILSTLSLSSCQTRPAPVRDTDGNILRSGTNYYILPAVHNSGGGVTLARGSGQLCPLEVVQEVSEAGHGLPMNFLTANKDGIIRESMDLNIKVSDAFTCAPNTVWRVVQQLNGQRTLSTQGVLGRPGPGTVDNWFKIGKYEDGYKVVHCPSVCHSCRPVCADVGSEITNERGRKSLVLNNKALKVMFKKA